MNHSPVIVWKHINPGLVAGYINGMPRFYAAKSACDSPINSHVTWHLADNSTSIIQYAGTLEDCFRKAHQYL